MDCASSTLLHPVTLSFDVASLEEEYITHTFRLSFTSHIAIFVCLLAIDAIAISGVLLRPTSWLVLVLDMLRVPLRVCLHRMKDQATAQRWSSGVFTAQELINLSSYLTLQQTTSLCVCLSLKHLPTYTLA